MQAPAIDWVDLDRRVVAAARKKLTSVLWPALEKDPALADWVRAGLELHQAGEACKFCESGALSESLRTAYSAHFDASSAQLRDELELLAQQVEQAHEELRLWWDRVPHADDLLPAYQVRWKDLVAALDGTRSALADHLDQLAGLVSQRSENLYEELAEIELAAPVLPALTELGMVIANNNADVGRMAEMRQEAESKILRHLVTPSRESYATAAHRLRLVERVRGRLDGQVRQLRQEERCWRDEQQDVGQMADLINQEDRKSVV